MKTFNENPFAKDTPVHPFSNGTEFMIWTENNCDCCCKINRTLTESENKGCELEMHLGVGTITGEIPLWVAKEIGCKYNPMYGYVDLDKECREFRTGDEPF